MINTEHIKHCHSSLKYEYRSYHRIDTSLSHCYRDKKKLT